MSKQSHLSKLSLGVDVHLGVSAAVLLRVSIAGDLRGCVPEHLEVDVAEAPIGQQGWTRGEQVDAHPRLQL